MHHSQWDGGTEVTTGVVERGAILRQVHPQQTTLPVLIVNLQDLHIVSHIAGLDVGVSRPLYEQGLAKSCQYLTSSKGRTVRLSDTKVSNII